jgi:hypothetical protein
MLARLLSGVALWIVRAIYAADFSSVLAVNDDRHSRFLFTGTQIADGDAIHCFQRGSP